MEEMEEMEELTKTLKALDGRVKKAQCLKLRYMEQYDKFVALREELNTIKTIKDELTEEQKQLDILLRELVKEKADEEEEGEEEEDFQR